MPSVPVPFGGPGPSLASTRREGTSLRGLAFTASDVYCFLSNTTEPSTYHAIGSVSGGMSRMGRTSATALFVLAIATLALVTHVSASITVRDLGTLPGYPLSEGFGINAAGRIVGTSGDGEAQSRPFLWDDGVMTNLGTLGGSRGTAHGISDTGLVVGESEDASHVMHAFLWQAGVMTDLGPGVAFAVNGHGQAVGCGFPTSPSPPCHAVLWADGGVRDLGSLGGRSTTAFAINDAGQVVGISISADDQIHGFLWQDGVMTALPTPDGGSGAASDINDAGQAVGGRYLYTAAGTPAAPSPGVAFFVAAVGLAGATFAFYHVRRTFRARNSPNRR